MGFTIGHGCTAYALKREPKGELFHGLLKFALNYCDCFSLTIRPHLSLSAGARALLLRLEPFRRAVPTKPERLAQIFDAEAKIGRYEFCVETLAILMESSRGLYAWQQPSLPEDLSIFRHDETDWLVSNAVVRMGYLILSRDERGELLGGLPKLGRMIPP